MVNSLINGIFFVIWKIYFIIYFVKSQTTSGISSATDVETCT